jgi:YhgE/Pip-like protein
MKNALMAYLKKSQTTLAFVVALMAQIIFCVFWMTAYDGVLDRTNHLKIAIVNEDGELGKSIEQKLKSNLPFKMISLSKEDAMQELEQRNIHLIITIPEKFSESLKTPGSKAKISFTMNESNAQLPKGIMQNVVSKVTNELNTNAAIQGTQTIFEQLKMPSQQASQAAQNILNKVESDIKYLHPVKGMNNQMVPMMLVLGSYVGAMLMAMNLHQVSLAIGSALTKGQHFAVRILFVVLASIFVSLIGSSIIIATGGQMESGFTSFWLFHWLTVMTFMFFAQMFLMVMGMAGMFVNMSILSLQLVSSGTIVPKQMLSGFYQWIAHFLPATYSVEGLMNLQFGGIHTMYDVGMLIVFSLSSVCIGFAATMLKKQNNNAVEVKEIGKSSDSAKSTPVY